MGEKSKGYNFRGVLYEHQPPGDDKYYNQETLTATTKEEMIMLRKPPTYEVKYLIVQIILFLTIGIIRAIIATFYTIFAGSIFVILCSVWRSLGRPPGFRDNLKVLWAGGARVLLFLLGIVKINFNGDFDTNARFVVANHTCFFDSWLFLPFYLIPMEKKETFRLPVIKDMGEIFGGIPVDRTKSSGLTKELLLHAQDPSRPQIFCLPEGASTNGEYMYRFHLGAFLSDLPVQPVAIRYTLWGTNRKISSISFFHKGLFLFVPFLSIPFITVNVNFLEVLTIKSAKGIPQEFADQVALLIGNKLGCKVLNLTTSTIFKTQENTIRH